MMETCNNTCQSCIEKIFEYRCGFCKTPYTGTGFKGFWCQEACWRLNKVMTGDDMKAMVVPDRSRLEKVYGKDTPQFSY
jgi:hypothetical protein